MAGRGLTQVHARPQQAEEEHRLRDDEQPHTRHQVLLHHLHTTRGGREVWDWAGRHEVLLHHLHTTRGGEGWD